VSKQEKSKSKIKQHFKFFANNSPQLRERVGGSHSPPKGKFQGRRRTNKKELFLTQDQRREESFTE